MSWFQCRTFSPLLIRGASRNWLSWALKGYIGSVIHRIHHVLMAKIARVPVLFIHEPASVIPVGFW